MIFAASLNVAGRIHLTQVNGRAIHSYGAGLDQLIIAIKIGQIASMPFGGQVGRVAIPVKQSEGRIIMSKQIVVDDIITDEVETPRQRSEESREGKEGVSTCRARWSPDHSNTNTTNTNTNQQTTTTYKP